jgi:uncharacterized protein YjiS (DUF1127 family)
MSHAMSERASRRAGHVLGALFFELWEQHRRQRREQLPIYRLKHLDDHLLRDISLSREGIEERVRDRR